MDPQIPQHKVAPLGKRPPQPPPARHPMPKAQYKTLRKRAPHPPPSRPPPRAPVAVGEENMVDAVDQAKPITLKWESQGQQKAGVRVNTKMQPYPSSKSMNMRPPARALPPPPQQAAPVPQQAAPIPQQPSPQPQAPAPSSQTTLLAHPQAVAKRINSAFGRIFGPKDGKGEGEEGEEEETNIDISNPSNFRHVDGYKHGTKLNEIPDLDFQSLGQSGQNSQSGQSGQISQIIKKKKDYANIKPKTLLPNEHRVDLEVLKQKMTDMESKPWDLSLVDYWSTRQFPIESWVEDDNGNSGVYSLAAKEDALCKGYHIEECKGSSTHNVQCDYDCVTCKDVPVLYADKDIPYYELFFADRPHENYFVESPNQPLIISIVKVGEMCKVLIWSKKENRRVLVSPDNPLKTLKTTIPELK